MSFFKGVLSNGASLLTGRLWQVAAIGLFAALLGSSAYLGYRWHDAASTRDEALKWLEACNEAKEDLTKEIGSLETKITFQNDAIQARADASRSAGMLYDIAKAKADAYGKTVDSLRKELGNRKPSATCEVALQRQREAIDKLKSLRTTEVPQ